jgi:transposase
MPAASRTGRPRGVDLREVINAIRYLVRSGCEWRMLPRDFPPWQTVYWWFRRFVRRLLFRVIQNIALMMDRQLRKRAPQPSNGVLYNRTVKTPAGARGYDANKKIPDRKPQIAVDTEGRLLMVNLTAASISDSAGAPKVLDAAYRLQRNQIASGIESADCRQNLLNCFRTNRRLSAMFAYLLGSADSHGIIEIT